LLSVRAAHFIKTILFRIVLISYASYFFHILLEKTKEVFPMVYPSRMH
jgi:hypothetical protein